LVQTVHATTLHFRLSDRGRAIHYRRRLLRPALLAADIVETVLGGRPGQALMLKRLERPVPASWDEQRRVFRYGDYTAAGGFR
jgi:hypothetical protein